jgi:hypothetical protein
MKSKNMKEKYKLEALLAAVSQDQADRLAFFALVNLGFIESLANGLTSAAEAVSHFYFADNCLFVRKVLKDKTADRIMSHGVQLPDLFDSLPTEKAQREFLHELATMRSLCLQLLESRRQVA